MLFNFVLNEEFRRIFKGFLNFADTDHPKPRLLDASLDTEASKEMRLAGDTATMSAFVPAGL